MKFRAPGRVNLIGEHTDYNQGFVLPIALDLATYVETSPSPDDRFHLESETHEGVFAFSADQLPRLRARKAWFDYVVGVARQLPPVAPMKLHIRSDVPEGAGLSSSAALEVSSALAFLQGREFDRLELALLCQRAEIEYVGMPCGIMDQYVSVFGQPHAAIRIDCRTLEHETVEIPDDVAIVAVNSMVKHELGDSAYRTRVQECAEACAAIGVSSLRDATLEQAQPFKRARHVVSENLRVLAFVDATRRHDLTAMGRLFVESHRSMQHDYEISCEEIDFLVDTAIAIPGCYGARMTGGGFGGSTVNLVEPDKVEPFTNAVKAAYRQRFGIDSVVFRCIPGPGAGQI